LGIHRIQIADFRQRRQFVEIFEIEIIEEFTRGGVHGRTPRHILMTDDTNPLALDQGFHDVAGHGDAANVFDVAARNRLAIGNQRQCFEQCAAVALRFFFPQARDPRRDTLHNLKTVAAGDFAQFKSAPAVTLGYRSQRLAHTGAGWTIVIFKQFAEFGHGQRFAGGQQRAFGDLLQQIAADGIFTGDNFHIFAQRFVSFRTRLRHRLDIRVDVGEFTHQGGIRYVVVSYVGITHGYVRLINSMNSKIDWFWKNAITATPVWALQDLRWRAPSHESDRMLRSARSRPAIP